MLIEFSSEYLEDSFLVCMEFEHVDRPVEESGLVPLHFDALVFEAPDEVLAARRRERSVRVQLELRPLLLLLQE